MGHFSWRFALFGIVGWMSASSPLRHLVRRSGLVAFGGEADVRTRTRNDAIDPKRHFGSVN